MFPGREADVTRRSSTCPRARGVDAVTYGAQVDVTVARHRGRVGRLHSGTAKPKANKLRVQNLWVNIFLARTPSATLVRRLFGAKRKLAALTALGTLKLDCSLHVAAGVINVHTFRPSEISLGTRARRRHPLYSTRTRRVSCSHVENGPPRRSLDPA